MKKQIIVIHGGDTYDTYKEYVANLKREKVEEDDLIRAEGWKQSLRRKLGRRFQVITPRMPNPENARYLEWKIWFEKFLPHLNNDFVLIGHSLGSIFLTKYLAENALHKRMRAVLLVAAPWNIRGSRKSLADFVLPKDLSRLAKYGDKVHFYHSKDDDICNFSNLNKYHKALPDAQAHVFKDRGHFISPQFPEIVRDIKALYKKQ
jgi:hypothetical protein